MSANIQIERRAQTNATANASKWQESLLCTIAAGFKARNQGFLADTQLSRAMRQRRRDNVRRSCALLREARNPQSLTA